MTAPLGGRGSGAAESRTEYSRPSRAEQQRVPGRLDDPVLLQAALDRVGQRLAGDLVDQLEDLADRPADGVLGASSR